MVQLDYADIQGIVLRGYSGLPAAHFVLLKIDGDARGTGDWLRWLAGEVTCAEHREERGEAVHVAFTLRGIRRLGLTREHARFSCEFEEGMTARFKQDALGDHGASAPCRWRWGGTQADAEPIHVLLMLYARAPARGDDAQLEALYEKHRVRFEAAGLVEVERLPTLGLRDRKEHFGFADGIAQPIIDGTPRAKSTANTRNVVAAGEIILGYRNEYGKYPDGPTIPPALDPEHLLPELEDGTHDLGHNGTYVVFRQLEQDVKAFWEFVDSATARNGCPDPRGRDLLAAKMVGRWRSGVSLVQSPARDDPRLSPGNSFAYVTPLNGGDAAGDPLGLKCPLGSHVRRANPRDSVFPGTSEPLTTPNAHRILRRGRSYGEPIAPSMEPADMLDAPETGEDRGIHFICLNTDLGRQFEFVQQSWLNNPKFGSMYRDLDPLVGDHGPRHRSSKGTFTIPAEPVRRRVTGVSRYVSVRGGAYFFLPGINGLRVLAGLPEAYK